MELETITTLKAKADENTSSESVQRIESRGQRHARRDNELVGRENEIDGYDCPICRNKAWVFVVDSRDESVAIPCKCQRIRKSLRRVKATGIGENLKRYTFESFIDEEDWQKKAKTKAMEFAEDPSGWLYISGQVGCGKSHLCTAVVGKLLEEHDCLYMMWRDEITKIKQHANKPEYADYVNPLKSVDVLYIDDFLKGYLTEADKNIAYEIINARYTQNKITIISTEKFSSELLNVDEAIASRIKEKARGHIIDISRADGRNWRTRKAEAKNEN